MKPLIPFVSLAVLMLPVPALAQSQLEPRVDRLEREMRAVQRKVFPGGAVPSVEPQITAPQQPVQTPGIPIGSPLANLESRVSALEAQFSTLTGQIEQAQYRTRQLEEQFAAYRKATDSRLSAIETGGAGVAPPVVPAPTGATAAPAVTTTATAAAIEKPSTGDAGEDEYIYGYRLWQAKRYAEAQKQLSGFIGKYPKHRRASFAQNLLGRAYLDAGKNQEAAKAFFDNYTKLPEGERAADSLFYLTKALQKLKAAPAEICKVYSALETEYAGKISLEQQADVDRGKAAAKCR